MTRVLILGKSGQIGAALVAAFAGKNDVVAIGRKELDLADPAAIEDMLGRLKPMIVINAAAFTAVDLAESNASAAMAINRDAPSLIAEQQKKTGGCLIHFSSDYVFDGKKTIPYVETDATSPLNVYGRSKLAGEQAILQSDCAHMLVRTSWVYGVHGENFCRTICRLARTQRQFDVAADQTGSPTSARTLALVVQRLVERLDTDILDLRQTLHIAGRGAVSRHAFALQIVAALAARFGKDFIKVASIAATTAASFNLPAVRPAYSALCADRLRAEFGIDLASWQDDLAAFVAASPEHIWS